MYPSPSETTPSGTTHAPGRSQVCDGDRQAHTGIETPFVGEPLGSDLDAGRADPALDDGLWQRRELCSAPCRLRHPYSGHQNDPEGPQGRDQRAPVWAEGNVRSSAHNGWKTRHSHQTTTVTF